MAISISRNSSVIFLILILSISASFILRAFPAFQMDFNFYGLPPNPDVWYNYRQIEVMVANFPQYNWFDPMTAFPFGKHIDWGPLFPVIASLFAFLYGAVQRFDILYMASWAPVLLGILMVPIVFILTRFLSEWKSGLIAAVFIATVSGEFFFRSTFGYLDHHIAEVLFTTIFCLCYIWTLSRSTEAEIDLRKPATAKIMIIPSILTGLALGASLLVALTCLLFVLIVVFFILFQYTWNAFHEKKSDYLFISGIIIFLCSAGCLLLIGAPSPVYSLITYSMAQIHLFIFLIFGLIFLQFTSTIVKDRPRLFVVLIVISIIIIAILVSLLNPSFFSSTTSGLSFLFGGTIEGEAISELGSSSFNTLWESFNIGIFLSIFGLILIVYEFIRKGFSAHIFVGIWGIVILVSTIQHIRWEYYCAVVIAVLSAYALGYILKLDRSNSFRESRRTLTGEHDKSSKKKRRRDISHEVKKSGIFTTNITLGFTLVAICLMTFSGISFSSDYKFLTNRENVVIPPQWVNALDWMQSDTPDPGLSFTGPYFSEDWDYPDSSYGVLSWWDYGHWITFIGERIPVTNPFQDNARSAAGFFLAESEETADSIAHDYGVKYVITDWRMRSTIFGAMIPWYEIPRSEAYYYTTFGYSPVPGSASRPVTLFSSSYYHTMISRLHNFDGSMNVPDNVVYIEFPKNSGGSVLPILSTAEILDIDSARQKMNQFNETGGETTEASLMGNWFEAPVEPVSALHYYRLIYESAGVNADGSPNYNQSVKVFEHVAGARFEGEGIIEVTVKTNLGRTFVYRQESEGGQFVLPYPTRNSSYPVITTGPYRMVNSGKLLEVDEVDVLEGNIILNSR